MNEYFKKASFLLGLSAVFIAALHAVLKPLLKLHVEIMYFNIHNLQISPPPVMPWLHREFYLYAGFFIYSIAFALISSLASKRLYIFRTQFDALLYFTGILFSYLILSIPYPFFMKEKAAVYILIIAGFFYLYFFKREVLFRIIDKAKYHIRKNYTAVVILLILFSSIQRSIALFLDPHTMVPDDSLSFYNNAVNYISGKVQAPAEIFSPGMTYFLILIFKLFGTGLILPKLFLIITGAVGLYFLSLFIKSFFHSKSLSVYSLFFYITSSHYVSFSNLFWNENLFNPILPVFLFITWKMTKGKPVYNFTALFTAPLILLYLTMLRSWFILPSFVWFIFLIFQSKKLQNTSALTSITGIQILFILILFSYNFASHKRISPFITENFELNYTIGNNPYSHGTFTRHYQTYAADQNIQLNENGFSFMIIEEQIKHPAVTASILGKKFILWFFSAGVVRPFTAYYQQPHTAAQYFYRFIASIFLFAGMFHLIRYRKGFILSLLYFIIFGVHMIFFVEYRFTLTAMPLQAILVSFGFMKFVKLAESKFMIE